MTHAPPTETSETSLTREFWHIVRYYLARPRTLLLLAALAFAGGIALNWSWLVAAGLAPLLITLLPCAVMCGLHMCMHKKSDGHAVDATQASPSQPTSLSAETAPSLLSRATAIREALSCCQGEADTAAPTAAVDPTSVEKPQAINERKDAEG